MATSNPSPSPAQKSKQARAGGSPLLRALFWLLILVAVSAASVGATWYVMQRQYSDPAAPVRLGVGHAGGGAQPPLLVPSSAPPAPLPAPIFIPLEPFTVTLQGDDTERMLHIGITLRARDEETRARIEKYMPEVRSRVLMVLTSQSPAAAQTSQGKTGIAKAIVQAVNEPFAPLPDGQYVSDALFTAFVVQ